MTGPRSKGVFVPRHQTRTRGPFTTACSLTLDRPRSFVEPAPHRSPLCVRATRTASCVPSQEVDQNRHYQSRIHRVAPTARWCYRAGWHLHTPGTMHMCCIAHAHTAHVTCTCTLHMYTWHARVLHCMFVVLYYACSLRLHCMCTACALRLHGTALHNRPMH